MQGRSKEWHESLISRAQELYKSDLSTVVQARYGLDQIKEAIEFYMKN